MRSRPGKRRPRTSTRRVSLERISFWACTNVGLKREANEDSYLADGDLKLFVVADGMGGHAGGATASRMAVKTIRRRILKVRQTSNLFRSTGIQRESAGILRALEDAVSAASQSIYTLSAERPALTGMGTTTTLTLIYGQRAYVAHVGDSRMYRLQNGVLDQVTEDHSLVNEQIKAGFITAEEAQHSRFKNIITRSVGFESAVRADAFSLPIEPGDVFLLCSDGLTGLVDDATIAKVLSRKRLDQAASHLVALANQNGGDDNITVIVLRWPLPGQPA